MKQTERQELLKKEQLRYHEYYDMQETFDNLYARSEKGDYFKHLYSLIVKDENLLLAYRTIKNNQGSMTPGTNRRTIAFWENMPIEEYLRYMKERLAYYQPMKVRRVEIPKANGKMRPLGIPCIEDRLIQQAIKQILEPICEAQFHKHSYGFRPNRSAEHAVAYLYKKINIDKCYYMVDVDIEGFFDNVDHGKLIKQLWTIGIRDKKVISIIAAMLKAEIEGIGIPDKGVPQGGILSPLLANVVLNELDWWIESQWADMPLHTHNDKKSSNRYYYLRKSKLKEMYIVRYADDFKIICKNKEQAERAYYATKQWLKERLHLNVSEEKSKITNVKQGYTEFLGFKLKAQKKGKKHTVKCKLTKKSKQRIENTLRMQIITIQHHPTYDNVNRLNRMIAGMHNYYEIATHVSPEFSEIHYKLLKCMRTRLRRITQETGFETAEYRRKYGNYKGKSFNVAGLKIYPIYGIKTKPPYMLSSKINNFTPEGRSYIHHKQGVVNEQLLHAIMRNPIEYASLELNDNRISKFVGQQGLCAVTLLPLRWDFHTHHIVPVSQGGTDEYANLALVQIEIHRLIHATQPETIAKYLKELNLDAEQLKRLNKFRLKVGNFTV